MKRALLVIAKRPHAGRTKTRLTPPLSARQAAELYDCFLRDTLNLARAMPEVSRYILYTPANEKGYFTNLAPDFELLAQTGNDLGERLDNAVTHCLSNGYNQVIIMNSDGPTLPPDYIAQAFTLLNNAEAVFGPSEDGGYYLIGLTQPQPRLVRNVQMSTPTVLQDTLTIAQAEGMSVSLLPRWYDVDTMDDLSRLAFELQNQPNSKAQYTHAFLSRMELWPANA